jgi:hypothetical protein
MGDIIGDVLGSRASITDDGMMKRRLWALAEQQQLGKERLQQGFEFNEFF